MLQKIKDDKIVLEFDPFFLASQEDLEAIESEPSLTTDTFIFLEGDDYATLVDEETLEPIQAHKYNK